MEIKQKTDVLKDTILDICDCCKTLIKNISYLHITATTQTTVTHESDDQGN